MKYIEGGFGGFEPSRNLSLLTKYNNYNNARLNVFLVLYSPPLKLNSELNFIYARYWCGLIAIVDLLDGCAKWYYFNVL